MDNNSEVLTVEEVAHKLRVCTQTVYGLARSGELPSLKIGRRVLIPRANLEHFLAKAGGQAR